MESCHSLCELRDMRGMSIVAAALVASGGAAHGAMGGSKQAESNCVPFFTKVPGPTLLTGDYEVVPVSPIYQREMMRRVARGRIQELDVSRANSIVGMSALPKVAHYYLVRMGFVGDAPDGTVPSAVSMKAEANTDGDVYVTSFLLSHSSGTFEIAAVVASPTPLRRVVSICGAAE